MSDKIARLRLDQAFAAGSLEAAKVEQHNAEVELAEAEETRRHIRDAAEAAQRLAHGRIATLVSRCLSAVFDEPCEFQLHFEQKRGKTEVRPSFTKGGHELSPLDGSGGVLDVAALALRVACLLLSRPALRRLLVLDEPFRWVSRPNRPRVASLLEALSGEMGIQFVLVTHDPEFQIGQVVPVSDA